MALITLPTGEVPDRYSSKYYMAMMEMAKDSCARPSACCGKAAARDSRAR